MAVIECAACLIFICICLPDASAIMPSYIPVTSGSFDCDSLIECYFSLGLSYSEIRSFLLLVHGIRISIRQLKRILCSKGLRRRRNRSELREIIAAVEREYEGSVGLIGYRQMHQRL